MINFNYSVSLDEKGNIQKKVRLIKYNSKILAFNISKPEKQSFFNSIEEFLDTVKDCEPEIFEDLTGEEIFNKNKDFGRLKVSANALMQRIIPEKKSQLRFD